MLCRAPVRFCKCLVIELIPARAQLSHVKVSQLVNAEGLIVRSIFETSIQIGANSDNLRNLLCVCVVAYSLYIAGIQQHQLMGSEITLL